MNVAQRSTALRARADRWRRRVRTRLAATVVALFGFCAAASATAETFPSAAGPLTAAQQQEVLAQIDRVGRRGFLYEVSRPTPTTGGPAHRLFLYGTIHLGRAGSEPFNAPMLAALRQSRRLALEADPTDSATTQALVAKLGQYDDVDDLQRHVSTTLMARVRAFGEKNGIPAERVGRYKPWLLANMVALTEMGGAGLDPALGSELYLTGFARGAHLPIVEIEGVEAQLRMLASLPDAMQSAQLDEALSDVGTNDSQQQTAALFALWLAGDERAGDALVADMHREADGKPFERYFVQTLIDGRNRSMADRAESCLSMPGNTFFAVGSLHLFGDAGLIHEFERRGYRVVDLQTGAPQPKQ